MPAHERAPRAEGTRGETRQRLIAAASEEFAQRGFANARVRHIVGQAQVNVAAVNYHFGGKEGLYRATLAYLVDRPAASHPARDTRPTLAPAQRLQRRIFAIVERSLQPQGAALGRILAHEAMNPTSHVEDVIAETLRPEVAYLRARLEELVPGATSQALDLAATGVLGQCLLYQFAQPALARVLPALPTGRELCTTVSRQVAASAVAGLRAEQKSQPIEAVAALQV